MEVTVRFFFVIVFLTLKFTMILNQTLDHSNHSEIFNEAIKLVQNAEESTTTFDNFCKTWLFALQHENQLPSIQFQVINRPFVISILGNKTIDHKLFYMYERSLEEVLNKIFHFGPSKFISNCQVVFISPTEDFKSDLSETIQKMEELTIHLTSQRLSRPHKDYFIYMSSLPTVINNFLMSNFTQNELRYKFGIYSTAIAHNEHSYRIVDGCTKRHTTSLKLFGRSCHSLLNGKHLLSSAVIGPPMLRWKNYPNGSLEEAHGVYFSLLEEFKTRANFSFNIQGANSGGASGFKKNGSWYGLVGEVFSREVQFGSNAGITTERDCIVDSGIPFAWIRRIFFVKAGPVKTNWKAIILPFDKTVWLATGLTLISIIPVYYYGALMYFKENPKQALQKHVLVEVISALVAILLEQSATARTWVGLRIRIMILLWALFCLIIETGYRSKLFQFLTFLEGEPVPRSHKQLVLDDYKIYFRYYGGIAYKYAKTSPDPILQTISRRAMLFNTSASCQITMMLSEKAACLDYEYHGDIAINTNATLRPHTPTNELILKSLDTAQSILVAFVFPKSSPLRESFDMFVIQTFASGLYNKWVADDWVFTRSQGSTWLKSQPTSPVTKQIEKVLAGLSTETKPLTKESLYSSFWICIIGYGIALVFYLSEIISFKLYSRRARRAEERKAKFEVRRKTLVNGTTRVIGLLSKTDIQTI